MRDCNQMEFPFHGQSAGDSLAKTSASQGGAKESLGRDLVSGRRCFDSSEMYGQRGRLLKMYQPFDLRGLPWSFKISARSGIAVNGIAYPLVPLALLTAGTASGSPLIATPTATANQLCPSMMKHPGCRNMWPTPRASEWKGVGPLGSKSHNHRLEKGYLDACVQHREQATGKLNPAWVEWLMGFPAGWTDLSNSGTP